MTPFRKGAEVKWRWAGGVGRGEVREVFTERVTRTLKGSEITRNADANNPAYLIEQADGDQVLKSHSELDRD